MTNCGHSSSSSFTTTLSSERNLLAMASTLLAMASNRVTPCLGHGGAWRGTAPQEIESIAKAKAILSGQEVIEVNPNDVVPG